MSVTVAITGAAGLLGKALIATASDKYDLHLFTRNQHPETGHKWYSLDLSTGSGLDLIYGLKPDIIIHSAAIGSVDYSQQNHHEAVNVNLSATIDIIKLCTEINCKLIYISTNAVFNGYKAPYCEGDLLSPINYYGISKAGAEYAVRYSKLQWAIIRPILMYGVPNLGRRGNWVTIWRDKFLAGKVCQVVDDVMTQPLYNVDCANAIWKTIELEQYGQIFHVAGNDMLLLSDFAYCVADIIGTSKSLIQPVPSSYFPSIAPRPANTTYILDKIHKVLGVYTCGVRDGVTKMLNSK